MSMEKQTIYGWPVIADLFLGGAGAGAFLAGFAMTLVSGPEPLAVTILFSGPLLVAIGTLFLLADITVRSRAYRLFSNPKSWTSRGSWILTVFIATGFLYALTAYPTFCGLPFLNRRTSLVVGLIAALSAFLVLLYPGLLMGAIKAISFWNTPLLPTLFLVSGLANGLAVMILTASLHPVFPNPAVEMLHALGGMAIALLLLQAASLRAFLARASRGNPASLESRRLLELSLFPRKMFSLGISIPLALFLFALFTTPPLLLAILSSAAALFSLAGGLYLRYAVIRAGVFLPRFNI